ncbi:MAG: Phosphatidylserine decarboxylase proenzyme [Pseudomonadales bacterium]|nr:Phosphatidylserine decarboxylase proenzyme [Pseudomonadales bacterium]
MNDRPATLGDRLFVALQYLLPQHLLSRLLGRLAHARLAPLKNALIRRFITRFGVDMSEAAEPDPAAYPHFNAFFTRALRPGARTVDAASDALVSPADGAVSQIGSIEAGRIFQAKGHAFSAAELLADSTDAALFDGGAFATIYLSPRDYHRVHMPLDARLRTLRHVPGRLFSVNAVTAAAVPALFARNERVVCVFDTAHGPLAMVLVGAMVVAGIETVWTGPVAPAGHGVLTIDYERDARERTLAKGAEMGRFQLGSTVILLLPRGRVSWDPALRAGSALRMGQRIATLPGPAADRFP